MASLSASEAPLRPKTAKETIYRHKLVTRVTHWINVLVISLLLMSGLQIFNAHPRLYWGQYGADADSSVLELGSDQDASGGATGFTQTSGGLDAAAPRVRRGKLGATVRPGLQIL